MTGMQILYQYPPKFAPSQMPPYQFYNIPTPYVLIYLKKMYFQFNNYKAMPNFYLPPQNMVNNLFILDS
jgi:hypothetical protein